jgi:predicted nucleic acid-binding protein
MLYVLDTSVLLATLDASRAAHQPARALLDSTVSTALSTQTIRETLAVATRAVEANGLGLDVGDAWQSLATLRAACDQILYESPAWLAALEDLVLDVRPRGRTIYDLGQAAFVRATPNAVLVTDDRALIARYRRVVPVLGVRAALGATQAGARRRS